MPQGPKIDDKEDLMLGAAECSTTTEGILKIRGGRNIDLNRIREDNLLVVSRRNGCLQ